MSKRSQTSFSSTSFSLICLLGLAAAAPSGPARVPIGRRVEDFQLKDHRGRAYSLADFQQSKLLVVVFLGTECPLAKLYAARLAAMAAAYVPRGVGFVAVDANRQDSITEIAAFVRLHKLPFPVLKDLGNRLADQMGAVRTPEVFVLDRARVICYWGRVDDQYGVGFVRDAPTRADLEVALDELLAGKPVSRPQTPAAGCYIGRVRRPETASDVTYSNQVARLLQRRCVECHREGDIAPFALTDYDEVAGWAETIAEVVRDERMPPWHAAAAHGRFANDRRMSSKEKELLVHWAAAGAPEGDRRQLPVPRRFVEGWQLPQKPDRVIAMAQRPFTVPAEGEVKYQYFSVDPGFTEERWIKMGEVQPGNRAVVHHILVFVQPPGVRRGRPGVDGVTYFLAYVPGLRARPYPAGMGKRIPAGSKLVFQVHYTPIGSVQRDLSKVGLVFADPAELTHEIMTTEAINTGFRIPPHADNYRVEATTGGRPSNLLLLSMTPHMHLRGKSFRYTALLPDGHQKILLDVPRYDFNWQTSYRLLAPKRLPAGTRIRCVAHFDNSAANQANPDPTIAVGWGDQTWDEMMIGYFEVATELRGGGAGEDRAAGARAGPWARARELLARLDHDGDGAIARGEVPKKHWPVFTRLDRDRDSRVTLEELAAGMRRRQGGQ